MKNELFLRTTRPATRFIRSSPWSGEAVADRALVRCDEATRAARSATYRRAAFSGGRTLSPGKNAGAAEARRGQGETCERALGVEARGEAGNDDILSQRRPILARPFFCLSYLKVFRDYNSGNRKAGRIAANRVRYEAELRKVSLDTDFRAATRTSAGI
jgi:hypothetical protein